MNLRKNELRVYYQTGTNVSVGFKLDRAIEKALAKFGYRRWDSGVEPQTGVRNLSFDKIEEQTKKEL